LMIAEQIGAELFKAQSCLAARQTCGFVVR
jgi:hypothetical protein